MEIQILFRDRFHTIDPYLTPSETIFLIKDKNWNELRQYLRPLLVKHSIHFVFDLIRAGLKALLTGNVLVTASLFIFRNE